MSETNTQDLKIEIREARAGVHRDLSDLDRELHVDMMQSVREHAPILAAGAAGLGALIGFGGAKAVKWLVAIGVPAGAIALYLKRKS